MPAFIINRWPKTDGELHAFVKNILGVDIPTEQICEDHVAPFDVFAEAFFNREDQQLIVGSRGLSGKSHMMGTLVATEALIYATEISVLGGSFAQSQRVQEVCNAALRGKNLPANLIVKANTDVTTLTNGAVIWALLASQRSVRGKHGPKLRLDEADEFDLSILDASLGMPMEQKGVQPQTMMISTHQYPDGVVTELIKRSAEQGFPYYKWCYRESMGNEKHPGWLTQAQVDRKKKVIPTAMWEVEYELSEPSFEGRAIDSDSVGRMFTEELTHVKGENGKYYEFELPDPEGRYVTGVDWAQKHDFTVITTYRADVEPWRMVAFLRVNRQPWPVMVGYVNKRLRDYGGILVHDSGGVGAPAGDFLDYNERQVEVIPFTMQGRAREALFSEYIAGIEGDHIRAPRIDFAYSEHLYALADDLFKGGSGHPPDSLVSGALAWSVRNRWLSRISPPPPVEITRPISPWKI